MNNFDTMNKFKPALAGIGLGEDFLEQLYLAFEARRERECREELAGQYESIYGKL